MKKSFTSLLITVLLAAAPAAAGLSTAAALSLAVPIVSYAADEDEREEVADIDWITKDPENDGAIGNLNDKIKDGGRSINMLMVTVGSIVAVVGVMIIGFKFILGNSMQKGNAKVDALWAVAGIMIIFGAVSIVSAFAGIGNGLFR